MTKFALHCIFFFPENNHVGLKIWKFLVHESYMHAYVYQNDTVWYGKVETVE